jgi:DHA3 family macrolide efflux protein-like MFS transporter
VLTGVLALILSGFGFALVGLAPANALWLAIGAMFFAGSMTVIVNGSIFAMLQAVVPPEVQGRVFTVVLSGSGAMAPLGLAIAGPLADALGERVWFVIAGALMSAMGVGALFMPALMRIEDKKRWNEAAPTGDVTAGISSASDPVPAAQ